MKGLREKKKIDSQRRIEESALKLFDNIGFEAATMEKIAEDAELGVGTLYNYYPSKADILMGIIAKRAVPYGEELHKIAVKKSENIEETLGECLNTYLTSFAFFSRRIWKEFTITAMAKDLPLFMMVRNVDGVFIQALGGLIRNLVEAGLTRPEISVETAAETLYSILFYHIMFFISGGLEISNVREMVLKQWKTVTDSLIK